AYYVENRDKLKAVPIVEKDGKPAVSPSMETVIDGTYQPLARPIFIYVNARSAQKPDIREFVEYYNRHGEKLAREVKYIPLPSKAYSHNLEVLSKKQLGTKFGGENKVGLTIEQLMEMEAKL
ncbi:MAG: protein sphX, partial [Burkholderiales bacterium]